MLKNDFIKKDKDIDIDKIINELHEEFFYTIGPKDHDNMLKMSKNIYKDDVNMYKEYKEEYKEEEYKEKENDRKNKKEVFNKLIIDALSLPKNN